MSDSTTPATKSKLYRWNEDGGIYAVPKDRDGYAQISNYVLDLWLPLLGIDGIGLYTVYARLQRDHVVKGMSMERLSRLCGIGKKTLQDLNRKLENYGFISINHPEGYKRRAHFTLEITVLEPPRVVSSKIIDADRRSRRGKSKYEILPEWLVEPVAAEVAPEVLSGTARSSNQNRQDCIPLSLKPSEIKNPSASSEAGEFKVSPTAPKEKKKEDIGRKAGESQRSSADQWLTGHGFTPIDVPFNPSRLRKYLVKKFPGHKFSPATIADLMSPVGTTHEGEVPGPVVIDLIRNKGKGLSPGDLRREGCGESEHADCAKHMPPPLPCQKSRVWYCGTSL